MELNVTNINDTGAGSLREALAAANSIPGADTITLASSLGGQTISLTSGELTITDDVTIDGSGASQITVDGNHNSRIFNINDGTNNEIEVAIEGLTITGGNSYSDDYDNGGGIYNQEDLTITNSTISDNSGNAGGIYSAGTLTINNSSISDNDSTAVTSGRGGGILSLGTLTINNSSISGNDGGGVGGGIFSYGTLTINNSSISGNDGGGNGGGIYSAGTLTINNSSISDNDSSAVTGNGGGIFSLGTLTIDNSSISGNDGRLGGGIYSDGTLTINNSDIVGNHRGRGIFSYGTLTINNSDIAFNGKGGIVNHGSLAISKSAISRNDANYGGGILNFGQVSISNSTISGNSAYYYGGGIANYGSLTISNSTMSGNHANYNGGGIANYYGEVSISNSTISGNHADDSGGGIANDGEVSISNSTIYNNTATLGGAIAGRIGTLSLANSIVSGNSGGNINHHPGLIFNNQGGNLIDEANPGLGPLADNGGPTLTHALLPNSPAINAGVNSLIPSDVTTDQRGTGFPRIVDGIVDSGAFESPTLVPSITLSVNPTSVLEDSPDNLIYTFTRSGSHADPLTVNFTVAGTATLSNDYTQTGATSFTSTNGSINFNPGDSSVNLTIDPQADNLVEPNETVIISLATSNNYQLASNTPVTGTILNDEILPVVAFSQANYSANEGNGSGARHQVIATLTRTGNLSGAATVPVILSSPAGSATAGSDYTNNFPLNVNFNPGQNSANLILPILRDNLYEANETIKFKLGTPTGATLGNQKTANFTILNDDSPPSLTINDVQVVEGATSQAILTVNLTSASGEKVVVAYATADGTALANSDYRSKSGLVTFNPGETSKTVAVNLVNNNLSEEDEHFSVNLSNPSANVAITDGQGLATISDTLRSNVTTILPNQVENLTLTGNQPINGTGNNQNNLLSGNNFHNFLQAEGGNDQIFGQNGNDTLRGGPGDDLLTGGAHADQFSYNSGRVYRKTDFGKDTIADLASQDKLLLSKSTFTSLASAVGNGLSVPSDFALVADDPQASTSSAFLVFSTASHTLFYNQNGASAGFGSGDALAVLSGVNNLAAHNFVLEV